MYYNSFKATPIKFCSLLILFSSAAKIKTVWGDKLKNYNGCNPFEEMYSQIIKLRRYCGTMADEEKRLINKLEQFGYAIEPKIEVSMI